MCLLEYIFNMPISPMVLVTMERTCALMCIYIYTPCDNDLLLLISIMRGKCKIQKHTIT